MSYQIDLAHSQVQFTVRHMMISKVRGVFEKFSGDIHLDEKNPANTKVEVKVETATVNTREPKRDEHLRSADFFDAGNYPTMDFTSKRVDVTSSTTANLVGDLTIRDVTREVVLEVVYAGAAKSPWGTTSFGFSGHTVINRKDWNLTWNAALETGGMLVSDEVSIDIELELVQVPEQEKAVSA